MSRHIFKRTRLLKSLSNLTLNTCRNGVYTTSLVNMFQCFITLIAKKLILPSILNHLSFSLKPLPFLPPQQALLESCSPSFLQAPSKYWKSTNSALIGLELWWLGRELASMTALGPFPHVGVNYAVLTFELFLVILYQYERTSPLLPFWMM